MSEGLTSAEEFIKYAIERGALGFPSGGCILKSGRLSPYFFNAGRFDDGESQEVLAFAYASVIARHFDRHPLRDHKVLEYDLLYGPPYKGTMLVPAIATQLYEMGFINTCFCSSRKEEKKYGEEGLLIGAPIEPGSRVVIVDDVITDGGTKREAVEFIRSYEGKVVGLVIAFDRQERGTGTESAAQEFTREYGVPVYSIATLVDLISYFEKVVASGGGLDSANERFDQLRAYRSAYGVR